MGVTFRGVPPDGFYKKTIGELVSILNDEGTRLESELVRDSPGDLGGLRGGWVYKPATPTRLVGVVSNPIKHFLPLELGRKPGKGISAKGQAQVAKWAVRKGVVPANESKSFAFLLSRKYKAVGRPAEGFAGLAKPGQQAKPISEVLEPVGGPIKDAFDRLAARLK